MKHFEYETSRSPLVVKHTHTITCKSVVIFETSGTLWLPSGKP